MNIIVAGLDYKIADITQREEMSFTKTAMLEIYERLLQNPDIYGSVIISTCNRTEIYISCRDDKQLNPFLLLGYNHKHYLYRGDEAINHLCQLACGVKSQIWGEDQIITQVKQSIAYARECRASDSILEVLFRTAITAAKKVKSLVDMKIPGNSIGHKALEVINNYSEKIQEVLVIGNGEIGRLVSTLLLNAGYQVTVTLRQYKHGQNFVPAGANTIDYADRYLFMHKCQAVVSATLSPHHTVERNELEKMPSYPKLFIDLAMPRDIAPEVTEMDGVTCFNVDNICKQEIENNHKQQLSKIEAIIEKNIQDFHKWISYRKSLNLLPKTAPKEAQIIAY